MAKAQQSGSKPKPATQPKKPRKSGGPRVARKQVETIDRIVEETRRREESIIKPKRSSGDDLMPVFYSYKFTTAWQGFATVADKQRWERERRLYGIIKMSNRFTIHDSELSRLTVKYTASGAWTAITHVYLEFSDNERKVPAAEMQAHTDPMHLLEEFGG